MFNTPILLITFNRPEHTRKVLESIRVAMPAQLYVFQDGAREGNAQDVAKCAAVRNVIAEMVDWKCDLHTNYSLENLGCGPGPKAAIDWFFENVEQGIVMEDDCLPHPDFFSYCEELLERYKDENRVGFVNSTLYHDDWHCDGSYGFSHYMVTGAWAAWKRTWQGFDLDLDTVNANNLRKQVYRLTRNRTESLWWYFMTKDIQADKRKKSYWDYQMQILLFCQSAVTIHPKVNLISNIGFDEEGTHTLKNDGRGDRQVYPILPMNHSSNMHIDTAMDAICFAKKQPQSLWKDVKYLVHQFIKRRKR